MAHTGQDKSRKPLASRAPLSSEQIDAGWDGGFEPDSKKENGHARKAYASPARVFKRPRGGKKLAPPKLPQPAAKSIPPLSSRPSTPAPKSGASSFPPPPSSRRPTAVPSPPRPRAAASIASHADTSARLDLGDIPEIEPEEEEEEEEPLSQVGAGSLVPEPSLPASFGEAAAAGALLGQAPDVSLFAAPTPGAGSPTPASLDLLENRVPSVAPSSIAPTISDLDVINFAQQARRNQSTRVLLALALVAFVGVGVSVGVRGAPPSAAQQAPPISAAAVTPPTLGGQQEEMRQDRQQPMATVTHSAVQSRSAVVERQAPLVAPAADSMEVSTAAPTPSLAPRVPVTDKSRSVKLARRQQQGAARAPESATASAAQEGGMSWLVRAQQQEASKTSSQR